MLFFVATALAASPHALVIVTPGMGRDAFQPLVSELERASVQVRVQEFGCGLGGVGAHVDALVAELQRGDGDEVVVAHGYGATLALLAAERGPQRREVLLAPVLGPLPGPLGAWLAEQPVGQALDLREPLRWQGRDVWGLLVGAEPDGSCVSAAAAREAAGWMRAGPPLHLDQVRVPVWLGVSAGDALSPVEVVVPASRALPDRELVRFGLNRFDRADFRHGELLVAPEVLRAVRRAVVRP